MWEKEPTYNPAEDPELDPFEDPRSSRGDAALSYLAISLANDNDIETQPTPAVSESKKEILAYYTDGIKGFYNNHVLRTTGMVEWLRSEQDKASYDEDAFWSAFETISSAVTMSFLADLLRHRETCMMVSDAKANELRNKWLTSSGAKR